MCFPNCLTSLRSRVAEFGLIDAATRIANDARATANSSRREEGARAVAAASAPIVLIDDDDDADDDADGHDRVTDGAAQLPPLLPL